MENKAVVTIKDRQKANGVFKTRSRVTRNIKRAFLSSPNWEVLPDDMAEALDMVAHKIGRILCGDYNNADSWHDIGGYAALIEKRLGGEFI